jgi:hypothetical protein
MRLWRLSMISAFLLLSSLSLARASVVDATGAEAAYARSDFKAARQQFEAAAEQFRKAPKDSQDTKAYREAAYLYDRLADCCFTQRDWDGLKLYLDGLYVVSVSGQRLASSTLTGALESGISQATARYLAMQLDEAVRFSTLIQLKRSIGLVLYDAKGAGAVGEGAIKQFQALAAACRGVISVEDGRYGIDTNILDSRLEAFDQVYDAMSKLADLEALWKKYEPEGKGGSKAPPAGSTEEAPPPK